MASHWFQGNGSPVSRRLRRAPRAKLPENVTVSIFAVKMGIVSLQPGGVMGPETAWMTRMKLAALPLLASRTNSCVRVKVYASLTSGSVTMMRTVRMAPMNINIALGEHAQAIRLHAPMVNVSQKNTGAIMSETAQMEPMRKIANTQHANSLPVPVEPAITAVRNVMGELTAETLLMKAIALRNVHNTSSSVILGCASLVSMSVTITLIAKTAVMNVLVPTRPAEATSSLAPMATALVKIWFVMERMTAEIMEMKMDVKAVLIIFVNVTQANGLVQSLENASQF